MQWVDPRAALGLSEDRRGGLSGAASIEGEGMRTDPRSLRRPPLIGDRARMKVLLVLMFVLCAGSAGAAGAPQPEDGRFHLGSGETHWIYFIARPAEAWEHPLEISPRAQRRLEKVGWTLQACDLPVWQPWVDELRAMGIEPRVVSHWLNAVSAPLSGEERRAADALPFVRGIARVRSRSARPPEPRREQWDRWERPPGGSAPGLPQGITARADRDTLLAGDPDAYGESFGQLAMLGVPDLHAAGLTGANVLIANLDAGFHKEHFVFDGLDITSEYDFIDEDGETQNWNPDTQPEHSGDRHGALTLSAMAGFALGELVGPAYRASVMLGRTEEVASEKGLEEDTYVAGLEWADSAGVDIISTSLGYREFPDEEVPWGYGFEDLDGKTAVTTRGVNRAAARGILVITAVGNEGPRASSLLVPADSDSALAIGALTPWGDLAGFSSRGPTYDSRVKPDLCAQGVRTVCGSWEPGVPAEIARASGSSLSTPLVAGLAALVVEARPDLTAMELIALLRASGSRAQDPDNDFGYGAPWGPLVAWPDSAAVVVDSVSWGFEPRIGEPNHLRLRFTNRGNAPSEQLTALVHSLTPGIDATEPAFVLPSLQPGESEWIGPLQVGFRAELAAEEWVWINWSLAGERHTLYRQVAFQVQPARDIARDGLAKVGPNPWTGQRDLFIEYGPPLGGTADVDVFDVTGRLVVRLARDVQLEPRGGRIIVDPRQANTIPNGIFYVQLRSSNGTASRALLRLR